MGGLVRDHDELEVFQCAFEAAMEVFELSKSFPKEATYSLTDQIRRSSRSVCANIAEAWRKRLYKRSFVSKLSDAQGEVAETQVWLRFAARCRYVDEGIVLQLGQQYDGIQRSLAGMIRHAEKWCFAQN